MAKRLQHRGGTTSQHSTFTGAVREVTVDTDKNTLVVHDGATAGGHPLATATNFKSTGIDDNATSTAITIDSSERVGIGTASPAEELHLTSSGSTAFLIQRTGSGTGKFTLNATSTFNGIYSRDGSNLAKDLVFHTNSEKMRIDSSGNVGIGTSSPQQLINIESTSNAKIRYGYSSAVYGEFGRKSNGVHEWSSYENGGDLSFGTTQVNGSTTERMRIEANGNVGIGTSSPDKALEISGTNNISSTLRLKNRNPDPDNIWDFVPQYNNGDLTILDDGTERMRIDSSGRVLIGTTSAQRNNREAVEVKNTTGEAFFAMTNGLSNAGYIYKSLQSTGGTHYIAWFENSSGTNVGKITHNNSSTSFTTTSDYRLKENVDYTFDATTRLKQLKPARFNFIADADTTVDGFLAHEVQNIVPEAISGEKDETETKEKVVVNANGKVIAENIEQADWETGKIADEDGNTQYPTDSTWEATKVVPVYQGIDQSKLVPLLVKTIQELEARITTLENA